MLQGMFGRALLEPVLKLKMTELQDVCGNGNKHLFFSSYNFLAKSLKNIVGL